MKMKKIILKHLLKPILILKENGLGIPGIALKTIILDLKICNYNSRLLFKTVTFLSAETTIPAFTVQD
jgi:hypothetical protein